MICKEKAETKLLCPSCWQLCAPLDPVGKCPHCFEDSEEICRRCSRKPLLVFPKASIFEETEPAKYIVKTNEEMLAFFALFQWSRLDWPLPDVLIPLSNAKPFAKSFAKLLKRPIGDILRKGDTWECDAEALDMDQVVLVCNVENTIEECQEAISKLAPTFPKKGYLLSVFS